jgi:hypothetical protein
MSTGVRIRMVGARSSAVPTRRTSSTMKTIRSCGAVDDGSEDAPDLAGDVGAGDEPGGDERGRHEEEHHGRDLGRVEEHGVQVARLQLAVDEEPTKSA